MTLEPSQFGDPVSELLHVLDELVPLLRELDEDFWADWMETSQRLILASDLYGVEKLLSAYGGMGSFNDLAGNKRLESLSSRAYALAVTVRKDFRRNSN